jgi:hypothetical protein
LRIFIEALPHLDTLHYGFKYQALGRNGYCFCALATCLSPWRKKHHVNNDNSSCTTRRFHGQGLLQHCRDKGDDYHSATSYYLTNLFNNKSRLAQTALHHGINDQLRLTAEENSVRYFQDNKATDTNVDPSKDSKHVADVENSIVDERDGIFNNVEVNTAVAVRYDTHGHTSEESVVMIDAENHAIDEHEVVYDKSKAIDTNDDIDVDYDYDDVHESDDINTI